MAEQPETSASQPPPSPSSSPMKLSDCIEDLLHFTLSTYLQETPLGFSKDYCSRLLQIDEAEATPLYKHLARALEKCVSSRSFSRDQESIDSIRVDETVKASEKEWSEVIVDKGSEILNMLEGIDFELHVQEPYFSLLRAGVKTIEGRCAVGRYNRIAPGASLLVNKCLLLKVQHANHYNSFFDMLNVESLSNVLPGVQTIEEGVQIYRKFYAKEKETFNGVLAISVCKPASQPYISLANLLAGLGHDGVGALLGMMQTVGTVPNALPPPRSCLIESSMKLHRPDVKGCNLTNAARALAKHVNRSSEGWWGCFSGSDFDKNSLAFEVISHILNHSCWMNVHFIQPHECVFEVRVHEGYGARWSSDGKKSHTPRKVTPRVGSINSAKHVIIA